MEKKVKDENVIPVLSIGEKLSIIQTNFKANKSRFNSFGKYNFRSAEDILEAIKPFLIPYDVFVTVSEDYIYSHELPVIISTAAIHDAISKEFISVKAIVGVDLQQKGMQTPQAFGSASSYGKKYALGNLLLIDDTQDADASNKHGKEPEPKSVSKTKLDASGDAFDKAKLFVSAGGSIETIETKYELTAAAKEILKKL
jgi:hypothetical protein